MQRSQSDRKQVPVRSELAQALAACRGAFYGTALISGMSNILMLTGAMFMLEIYDRVLPSRSMPTLVGLLVLAATLFTALGVLDAIRGRILVRVGGSLDEALSGRVYDTLMRLPLRVGGRSDGTQPLRDLDAVRSYLSGLGPVALFDLPWIPLYLAICFAFHPLIGLTALAGAIILVALTLLTEILMRAPTKAATEAAVVRSGLAEASRRNAEALVAMGMAGRIAARWNEANRQYMHSQQEASDLGGGTRRNIKSIAHDVAVRRAGGRRVSCDQPGSQRGNYHCRVDSQCARACSGRSCHRELERLRRCAPGWHRLNRLLTASPAQSAPMELQAPARRLTVEGVSGAPPGVAKIVVQDVTFDLEAGQGLGVIGPSGSGKSSLARLLVGVWQPVRGNVRVGWRSARPMVAGCARPSHRLSAARRRVDGRHGGREHCAVRTRRQTLRR